MKSEKEKKVIYYYFYFIFKLTFNIASFGSIATRNNTRNSLVVFLFNTTSTALAVVNFVEFVALLLLSDLNEVKHKKFFFFFVVVVVVADAA